MSRSTSRDGRGSALFGVGLAAAGLVAACSGPGAERGPAAEGRGAPMMARSRVETSPAPGSSCERRAPSVGPVREGDAHVGSAVALARSGRALVAYVADPDAHAIQLVDVATDKTLGRTDLLGAPEQILVLADGRVVISLSDGGFVDVYEPTADAKRPLEHRCRVAVPSGPFGLASTPDDRVVGVTSAFDPALTLLDGKTLIPKRAIALARSPRGLLLEGSRAFVSHVVGAQLSVVDLESTSPNRSIDMRVRAGTQIADEQSLAHLRTGTHAYALVSVDVTRPAPAGPAAPNTPPPSKSHRIVVPMVTVDPGDRARPSQLYYGPPPVAGIYKQSPIAVVVDPTAEKSLVTHVLAPTSSRRGEECLLPRAAVFAPKSERIYVACQGIDVVMELDARVTDPMRAVLRRFDVPTSPTGLAVADDVLVVSTLERGQMATIDLGSGEARFVSIDRGPSKDVERSEAFHLGRELFHRSDDPRIAGDGVACASCHPEGLEDGVTWSTPEGPRQTLMLAGRLDHSAPYGWTRGKASLEEYLRDTMGRLGGSVLGTSELDALVKYVKGLPRPPVSTVNVTLAEKGRQAYEARGCGSCHATSALEDAPPKDVGSQASNDFTKAFDTPALTGVALTAPYYHDGRYGSLAALLGDHQSKMGGVADLSEDEQRAIEAYLGSL